MSCAFAGKRLVVFSGGEAKDTEGLLNEIRQIRDGGGSGSIIGRNSFRRPKHEALALLDEVIRIYLDEARERPGRGDHPCRGGLSAPADRPARLRAGASGRAAGCRPRRGRHRRVRAARRRRARDMDAMVARMAHLQTLCAKHTLSSCATSSASPLRWAPTVSILGAEQATSGRAVALGRERIWACPAAPRAMRHGRGEQGADYVAFGDLGKRPGAEVYELLRWWSDLFVLPCLAEVATTVDDCARLARAGADFVAAGEGCGRTRRGQPRCAAFGRRCRRRRPRACRPALPLGCLG